MTENILQQDLLIGEEYTEIVRAHKQLLFFMASARVRGVHLVRLLYGEHFDGEMRVKMTRTFRRALNGMKKRGEISFYLLGEELLSESTTARYLLEKCPRLANEAEKGKTAAFYIYL